MKLFKEITIATISIVALAACQKEKAPLQTNEPESITEEAAENSLQRTGHDSREFVYTLSNQAGGNKVITYRRSSDGMLTYSASFDAGGNGTGGGLGNQGALIVSDDRKFLLAVNAGSNTISSFRIRNNGLDLRCTINSRGTLPVSIAQHHDLVYVLNAGGTGNISGFRLNENGTLFPIYHSTRPLSSTAAGAAQISFVNDGKVLVITEKATNKIITYRLNQWDRPGAMHSITSANTTPFGFAPGKEGNIFVSEAAGGAPGASTLSSYRIGNNGHISLTQGPVGANQSAACWVVLTNNGKYAYTTNTASNNISSFSVNPWSGHFSVSEAIAETTGAGPIDAAIAGNSRYLYILNSAAHSIQGFVIGHNGSLSSLQTVSGLPDGANGLAATD
ncbi:MAG TPA: beta-propeller fold lactonase family protein [Chitinophagaceae bacterium]|nr:beta-propeller fold lactonase family protein [Chitinophagaceae bacterium]